ncbi:hypothetical protein [Gilvibacter sediminis]|uniref:hypothetical protein n=1 Tax=Gilvibacter sediminis TaxID=379071 RepID=UPI00234FBB4F|nr:hypothetical protein [Gilvibacter sediminis]MDC7997983.1 hypothetical protein [Gilvibacter sediminis]
MISKEVKEKAILSTQYKIDKLKRETGIFKRNKWKTIGFGVLISILGPLYNSESDPLGRSRNALEVSETSHLKLTIITAIFYFVFVVIAHYVWKKNDERRLNALEKKKAQLELEMELFHSE